MPTWIRFRYENGNTIVVNAAQSHLVFKPEDLRIEVYPPTGSERNEGLGASICVFVCETPEQVAAGEELIFEGLAGNTSVTVSLDVLDDHADYLNHLHGIRTILQLLHEGRLRIPIDEEFNERELFDHDQPRDHSEIGQIEEMLHTYLEVPDDALQRAFRKDLDQTPFELLRDHEECDEHGFHEYWVVATRPDHHYAFRHQYQDLVDSIVERDGLQLDEEPVA